MCEILWKYQGKHFISIGKSGKISNGILLKLKENLANGVNSIRVYSTLYQVYAL